MNIVGRRAAKSATGPSPASVRLSNYSIIGGDAPHMIRIWPEPAPLQISGM